MKIDKPSKPLPVGTTGGTAAHAAAKGKAGLPAATQQAGGTSVSLGSVATQLHSMENGMANATAVDAAKVAEIRQAISEGRFKVNSDAVASRLLETVRELIGGRT